MIMATERIGQSAERGSVRRCRRSTTVRRARTSVAVALPTVSPGVVQRPAAQGRVHLTARGRWVLLLIFAALLFGAFTTGRAASSSASGAPASTVVLGQMTVQPGETLWSVAHRLAPQRDPRRVVEQIRRLNHLRTVALQPGQQLLLPVAR